MLSVVLYKPGPFRSHNLWAAVNLLVGILLFYYRGHLTWFDWTLDWSDALLMQVVLYIIWRLGNVGETDALQFVHPFRSHFISRLKRALQKVHKFLWSCAVIMVAAGVVFVRLDAGGTSRSRITAAT